MLGGFGILIVFKTQPPPNTSEWMDSAVFFNYSKFPLVAKLSTSVRFDCVVNPVPVVGHLGVDSIQFLLDFWKYSLSIRYLIDVCVCVNAEDWHLAYLKCYTRGILVKLVMHQISVDKIENPCYWINRCTFDMVLPSILSTQYWASLIFSPSIVIGKIDHFCVPRGQWRFFIKIKAKASICSWEVCFCCCTH